ncbi:MAG: Maf family protein [Chloroflexi bacterium]|nr:Maf family protein [Chloroflexota bacterium]
MTDIILASASQGRAMIMAQISLPFSTYAVNIDESRLYNEKPQDMVLRLSILKARTALKLFPQAICIGADTIAVFSSQIFGKPHDAWEAKQMISALSGQSHIVLTGLCVIDGANDRQEVAFEQSKVTFRRLNSNEIDIYVASGRWQGKAGGYAVQDDDSFIKNIQGSRSNVIGLPFELLKEKLKNLIVFTDI